MEKNIFTVRVRPLAGESLSSFLRRISKENGINLLSFWNYFKTSPNDYAQYSDLDVLDFYPIHIIDIKKLSEAVCVEMEILLSGTFFYLLNLYCLGTEIEHSRFTSGMLREKLHYCPACLQDNEYHLLLWRIEGINICLRHRTLLLDKCPRCLKGIKYRDMHSLIKCPYCEADLGRPEFLAANAELQWNQQVWLHHTWIQLLTHTHQKMSPQSVALRVLYLINQQQEIFDKKRVICIMQGSGKLHTLLQHARDSLKQKRTLHISYILALLWQNHIDIDTFLNMQLPQTFIDSVLTLPRLKKETLSCQAPWCVKFGVEGALVQTGTSFKRKKNGEVLSYYLACLECGCEYAINDENALQERTYFIKGYHFIKIHFCEGESIDSMFKKVQSGLSLDQLKRCVAYFYTRDVTLLSRALVDFQMNHQLLNNFIEAINQNETIKSIRNWSCWNSYVHFLVYRFHQSVMQQLILRTRSRETGQNQHSNLDDVKKVVHDMYDQDITITIEAVAEHFRVSVTTIRNWGCCPYIREMKKSQCEKLLLMKKENIYDFVDGYLKESGGTKLSSSEIYKALGTRRSLIWRIAPELTAFIHQRIKLHNENMRRV